MEFIFKAKLSWFNKILTLLVLLFILWLIYFIFFSQTPVERGAYFALVAVIIILVIAYSYRPVRYMVNEQYVIIQRPFYQTKIPLKNIKQIKQISYEELSARIRLFGSSGFFGHFGIYHSTRFGKLYMNATQLNDLVLMILKNHRKIVVSPDRGFQFVHIIKRASIFSTNRLSRIKGSQ